MLKILWITYRSTISIKPIPRVKPKPKFMMREEFEEKNKRH